MADLVGTVGLTDLLRCAGVKWNGDDFEILYQELNESRSHRDLLHEIELRIAGYFDRVEIPEHPTVYDYILLGLREKDLIATFNWDPLLVQAYRRNSRIRRLPQMVFLHGNVAIGICVGCRVKGYYGDTCAKCSHPLERTRMLFPTARKDYISDPFTNEEWSILTAFLERAYLLTIFGYRAPSSDAAAVDLMHAAWSDNGARELAQIEVVDVRSHDDVFPSWKPFITSHYYGIVDSLFKTSICFQPRRSCDSLAWATLQQQPWSDNPIPSAFSRIEDLQSWIAPLLDEEEAQEKEHKAFSGSSCAQMRDHRPRD